MYQCINTYTCFVFIYCKSSIAHCYIPMEKCDTTIIDTSLNCKQIFLNCTIQLMTLTHCIIWQIRSK